MTSEPCPRWRIVTRVPQYREIACNGYSRLSSLAFVAAGFPQVKFVRFDSSSSPSGSSSLSSPFEDLITQKLARKVAFDGECWGTAKAGCESGRRRNMDETIKRDHEGTWYQGRRSTARLARWMTVCTLCWYLTIPLRSRNPIEPVLLFNSYRCNLLHQVRSPCLQPLPAPTRSLNGVGCDGYPANLPVMRMTCGLSLSES